MRKEMWITALIGAFIALLALSPVAYVFYRNQPPRVATVDLQKIVEEQQQRFISALSTGQVTDEQRAAAVRLTEDFGKKLSGTIDALGAECQCVIVNKAALLGGTVVDYTELVRERVK